MNSMSTRCRLESRMLPGLCFGLVLSLLLIKAILGFTGHRHLDLLEFLIQIALAAGFFHWIVSGKSSLWTINEVTSGIRMERDGAILYEGPASGLRIADENQGVMTLKASDGSAFHFPRRRVFHEVLSRIGVPQQAAGESESSHSGH